jgi:hypothetical protein
MVRYPLGGMMSWVLQYLLGFQRLGHDVWFFEEAGWPGSCYDPSRGTTGDDCSYGVATLDALLRRFGLGDRWCYLDASGRYHGLPRDRAEEVLRSTDVFIDMGVHGSVVREAASGVSVLLDGEPGRTQMRMEQTRARGDAIFEYDFYFTTGWNVGTAASTAPTGGRSWRHIFHPVSVAHFDASAARSDAPFTTVMNWQSHPPLSYGGRTYGQKDVEFERFIDLPQLTSAPLEVAVAGAAPRDRLHARGWRLRAAAAVTVTYDSFVAYIGDSRGEFSVCKETFVATNSGWFSDRTAAYLASGRPAVLQDTGFSGHLPCGEGVFAVRDAGEAAAALEEIQGDYERHARSARELAAEHLDTGRVLGPFLAELGV